MSKKPNFREENFPPAIGYIEAAKTWLNVALEAAQAGHYEAALGALDHVSVAVNRVTLELVRLEGADA